jgi:protocatechuate 3,4-dioxygenase beta subunit
MDGTQANGSITRRAALGTLGALGAAAALPLGADGAPACVVSPEMIAGPFFVDEQLNRSDIAGGAHGVPLRLGIRVFRVGTGGCAPLAGAHVDVWHADANGNYSDAASEHTQGRTFLRGYQVSGRDGTVSFTTIYPGWYRTRSVHVHVMVRTYSPARDVTHKFTSQLFFPDTVTDDVLADPAYAARGPRDTTNAHDEFYDRRMLVGLARARGYGYAGTLTLGLAT